MTGLPLNEHGRPRPRTLKVLRILDHVYAARMDSLYSQSVGRGIDNEAKMTLRITRLQHGGW